MLYPAGMILVAAWGCGNISAGIRMDSWRPYFKKGVMVGAAMALLVHSFPFWAEKAPGNWGRNLMSRLQGWRELGIEAGSVFEGTAWPQNTVILTFNRQLTSELAFYVPGRPNAYTWHFTGIPQNQYDLWEGPRVGWDALIVIPENLSRSINWISRHFHSIRQLGQTSEGAHPRYILYLGTSLKEWPTDRPVKSQNQ
jgi:hypothetical protein